MQRSTCKGRGRGLAATEPRVTCGERYSARRLDQLSELLAHLHCKLALETERRENVLKLKWDLLNEMCPLFELAVSHLSHANLGSGHIERNTSAQSTARAATAATRAFGHCHDAANAPTAPTLTSIQDVCQLFPLTDLGEASGDFAGRLGWEADSPSARTLPGGHHMGLSNYGVTKICREPELVDAALHAPAAVRATLFSKVRGELLNQRRFDQPTAAPHVAANCKAKHS